ncbi:MAG TPA: hypothetical protein VFQ61_28950 [Polyangiaceae bacterium]|nr:hypothetical protein [Polyangiaceae bacterium]
MAYWGLDHIRAKSADVRAAFGDVLTRRQVARRPNGKQWKFLQACLETLLGERTPALSISKSQATQYKFEIEDRLRRFYRSPGKPVSLVFALEHQDHAIATEAVTESYPTTMGYVLLVSDARPENVPRLPGSELQEFLLRVVDDAARAELAAYRSLPTMDLSVLNSALVVGSPAFLRIRNIVELHDKKGWCISAPPSNPSSMRMLKSRVVEAGPDRAIVNTEEYWYLRWWSLAKREYAYVYQETNRQTYFLRRDGERWLVEENKYTQPRRTTPQRSGPKRAG